MDGIIQLIVPNEGRQHQGRDHFDITIKKTKNKAILLLCKQIIGIHYSYG